MPESQPPAAHTPGPWAAVEPYKGRWCIRAPRTPDKASSRDFFAVVAAVGGDRSQHEANARLIAAAPALARAVRSSPCPNPTAPVDLTVEACLRRGECCCDSGAALAEATGAAP